MVHHRRNLTNDLKSKLSSHFERLCLALLQAGLLARSQPPRTQPSFVPRVSGALWRDAAGTSLALPACLLFSRINDIVGILAWKDSDMLDDVKKIYRAKYRALLEDDLEENVEKKFRPVVRTRATPKSRIKCLFHFTTIMDWVSPQVRVCVSDTRDDEVDEEQTYQDVRGLSEAYQVLRHPHSTFRRETRTPSSCSSTTCCAVAAGASSPTSWTCLRR